MASFNLVCVYCYEFHVDIVHSAVNENPVGAVQSYSINSNGTLTLIDTVSSGGDGPAFVTAVSTDLVAAMNYGSGSGYIIPKSYGGTFDRSGQNITFPPPAGGVSHPHMALEYYDEIFVPDLVSIVIYLACSLAIRIFSGFLIYLGSSLLIGCGPNLAP